MLSYEPVSSAGRLKKCFGMCVISLVRAGAARMLRLSAASDEDQQPRGVLGNRCEPRISLVSPNARSRRMAFEEGGFSSLSAGTRIGEGRSGKGGDWGEWDERRSRRRSLCVARAIPLYCRAFCANRPCDVCAICGKPLPSWRLIRRASWLHACMI